MFNTMTITKAAGALIGSLLSLMLLLWAGSALFHVGPAEGAHGDEPVAQAYTIPVESAGGDDAGEEEVQVDFASLMEAADPGAGTGIELSAIAACVIGGTSLMGGRGNAISTFLGVLVIAVLQTGLSRMSVEDANKQIITGVVIIIAVLIDTLRYNWEKAKS